MESVIKNLKFLYKPFIEEFDNAKDSDSNVRIFRDLTTDIYTTTFLNDDVQLTNFLDYTFHIIYSTIILDLNYLLMKNKQKPLLGFERVYLVFKGGTLMNKFYDSYIKNQFQSKYGYVNSNDINDELNVSVTPFNYDKEDDKLLEGRDDFNFFCNDILSKKFAVSDTDYSLYIYAENEKRFLIIHKFVVQLLARAFDILTDNFDNYINKTINNFPDTIEYTVDDSIESDLLDELKIFVDSKYNNSVDIKQQIDIDTYLNILRNLSIQQEKRIYYLYDIIELVTIFMYLESVYKFDSGLNLVYIFVGVKERIRYLVDNKFWNLVENGFYSDEKIIEFKTKLKTQYTNIQTNNIQQYYTEKYDEKKNKYVLRKDNNYTLDSFIIKPRDGSLLVTPDDILRDVEPLNVPLDKIQYITFNTLINKSRSRYNITNDFDLMRSKVNVVMEKGLMEKNGRDIEYKIASEFIDVSIPRYHDNGRIEYFRRLEKSGFRPYINKFKINNKNIIIYSYSVHQVAEDLQNVLFIQNSIEPWIDKKYKKRLVRFILFLMVSYYVDELSGKKSYDDIIGMLKIFDMVKSYLSGYGEFPYDRFDEIVSGKNIKSLLDNYDMNICQWKDLPEFDMNTNFEDLNYLIRCILMFSFLYYKDNDCLFQILDKYSAEYLQVTQYSIESVDEVRRNFYKLIDIFVDYGFKICYPLYKELNFESVHV